MSHSDFGETCTKVTVILFKKLKAGDGKENILISPFSIQTCMAMVFNGAKGKTAEEIATALGYNSKSPSEVAETFHNVLNEYDGSDILKIANKIYMQQGATLKSEYIEVTKEKYHAEAEVLDFKEKSSAANTMNTWVEKKTNGKIANLISPDALEEDTRLVLLNALHFKGQWRDKFDPSCTKEDDFWITKGKSVKANFMFQSGKFNCSYMGDLKCTALEMPYANSDLSMFVLLPKEHDGLKELSQKLQNVNLVDLAKKMRHCEVLVRFPKFKIEYSVEMSDVLQEMGISEAFSDRADFSNILDPAEGIYISKVFHKAAIDVNEEGTEAAAATACVYRPCCMPPKFVADHPFFYWIWNKKNIVLFAGAFVKPSHKA